MTDHTSGTAGSENGPASPVSDSGAAAAPPPPALAATESPRKHPFFEHADALGKLTTLALGVLYVLGILISNLQLRDLGISDFASLQARNVLTGFFFAVYFLWFLAVLAPIAVVATAFNAEWWIKVPFGRKKFVLGVIFVVVCAGYSFFFLALGNGAFALIYPWGNPDATLSQFVLTYLFHHYNTFAAALLLVITAGILAKFSRERPAVRFRTVLIIFGVTLAVVMPLVMSDYANEVYPNIKYNAGGGQPQIAAVVLAGKKSEIAGADAAGLPAVALCCEGSNRAEPVKSENPEESIKTGPVVVWYQSDKFIYLSHLGEVSPKEPVRARVVAIDIKLVRRIEYLPRYVEIHDGNKIEKIYQRDADGTVSPLPPPAANAPAPGEAPPAPARPAEQ
jgi:hypothetical protein